MPRRDEKRRKYLHDQHQRRRSSSFGLSHSQELASSSSSGQDSGIGTADASLDGNAGHGAMGDDTVVEENLGISANGGGSMRGTGSAANARKRKSGGNATAGRKRGRKQASHENSDRPEGGDHRDNHGGEHPGDENPFEAEFQKRADEFFKSIRQSCIYVCVCCGNTWFRKSVSVFDVEGYKAKRGPDLAAKILCVSDTTYICTTCQRTVRKGGVPKMCLSNGLSFPEIPEVLRKLTTLEARLCALRLPFLQLRRLGVDRQLGIKGQVVNLNHPINDLVETLPRTFEQSGTVQLKLLRHTRAKNPVAFETIRPRLVYDAVKYLSSQPLYQAENFVVSEEWRDYFHEDEIPFVVNPEETEGDAAGNNTVGDANQPTDDDDSSEQSIEQNDDDAENEPVAIGAEETLLDVDSTDGIIYAPGQRQTPVSLLRDQNAELLSFPKIYCGQPRVTCAKLSHTDVAKSELRRFDRRSCDPTHVLYVYKKLQLERVNSNISFALTLRKKSVGTVTASQLRDEEFVKKLVYNDSAYRILRNIRSAPSYFEGKKRDLMGMIRQLGIPTFFFTVSAAEESWPDLLIALHKLANGETITEDEAKAMPWEKRAELIRNDPVTCVRHFDHRFRSLWNSLLKSGAVFEEFELVDSFVRMEFQHRGSPHMHCLLWLAGAPKYVEDSEESHKQVCDFIDRFITVKNNDLATLQIHKHSAKCLLRRKNADGTTGGSSHFRLGINTCKYNFPAPPMRSTCILKPIIGLEREEVAKYSTKRREIQNKLEDIRADRLSPSFDEFLDSVGMTEEEYILTIRSGLKAHRVFLKRDCDASVVNAYNSRIARCFKSNMDIQFCLDPYSVAIYVSNYISKSYRGLSKLLMQCATEIKAGNMPLKDQLWKMGSTFLKGSETSVQEAAASILGIHFVRCSRKAEFIQTSVPEERVFVSKDAETLRELEDDCTDVAEASNLVHYMKRPVAMKDVCLASFVAWYQFSKSNRKNCAVDGSDNEDEDPEDESNGPYIRLLQGSGFVRKRTQAKVIRFRKFNRGNDPENFYREQVMLYVPWLNEEKDILEHDFEGLFNQHIEVIRTNRPEFDPMLDKTEDFENVQARADAEVREFDDEENPEGYGELQREFQSFFTDDDDVDNANTERNPAAATNNDDADFSGTCFSRTDLLSDENYHKKMMLLNPMQREFVFAFCRKIRTTSQGFCWYLAGAGGTGKSLVLSVLREAIWRHHLAKPGADANRSPIVVAAPTGRAAFNVAGQTLHNVFHLPINQSRLPRLDPGKRNELYTKIGEALVIAIDEISMVSSLVLSFLDERLRELTGNDAPFGDKIVLVLGDLLQLSPVGGLQVFQCRSNSANDIIAGPCLWRNFEFYELTTSMRANNVAFATALRNLASGRMTDAEISMFKSRECKRGLQAHEECVHLFYRNDDIEKFNSDYLDGLQTEGAVSFAQDIVVGPGTDSSRAEILRAATLKGPRDTYGLRQVVKLKIGAQYVITTNLDIPDGLANGTVGTLKRILYGTDRNNQRRPIRLEFDFGDNRVGRHSRKLSKTEFTRISVEKRQIHSWPARNLAVHRIQFPITAAKAVSIHKSQGATYERVCVHLEKGNLTRKLLYVATSRATSLEGLYFIGNFKAPGRPPSTDAVVQELERLDGCRISISDYDSVNCDDVTMVYHNVQSFPSHRHHILSNSTYMSAKLLFFVEVKTLETDDVTLPGFRCVHRVNCIRSRRESYGMLLYAKENLQVSSKSYFTDKFKGSHCSICVVEHPNVMLMLCYRSPKHPFDRFFGVLKQALLKFVSSHVVLMGDLNVERYSIQGDILMDLFISFGFSSTLKALNSTTGGSLIDYCVSNFSGVDSDVKENTFSYHLPILVKCDVIQ